MALYLDIPVIAFIERYLYPFGCSYSIKEDEDGRCLFYQDGCRIYPVRPFQCKTFPFWFDILRSPKKWAKVSKKCPGIGCGRLYSKKEIIEIAGSTVLGEKLETC
jgi:Fe-S-cluster containining protein